MTDDYDGDQAEADEDKMLLERGEQIRDTLESQSDWNQFVITFDSPFKNSPYFKPLIKELSLANLTPMEINQVLRAMKVVQYLIYLKSKEAMKLYLSDIYTICLVSRSKEFGERKLFATVRQFLFKQHGNERQGLL